MPIELLYIPLGTALFILAFIKNKSIRLDEAGITQGFSVFQTFMSYDGIAGVRKEVRSGRGGSAEVLVISEKNSTRRIVIPIASFDRIELGQILRALAHTALQALIEADLSLQPLGH